MCTVNKLKQKYNKLTIMTTEATTPADEVHPVDQMFDEEFDRRAATPKGSRDPLPDFGQDYQSLQRMAGTPELRGDNGKFLSYEEIAKRTGKATVKALMGAIGNQSEEVPDPAEPDPSEPDEPEPPVVPTPSRPRPPRAPRRPRTTTPPRPTPTPPPVSPSPLFPIAPTDPGDLDPIYGPPDPGDIDPDDPDDPPVDPTDIMPVLDLDPALNARLTETRNTLAALEVKQSKRGLARRRLRQDYEAAKAEYDAAYRAISTDVLEQMRTAGMDESAIKHLIISGVITESEAFTSRKLVAIEEDGQGTFSKPFKKFCKWWDRQKGAKGFFVKSLVGVGIGVPAGIFGAAIAGGVGLGAGVGLLSARIARGTAMTKLHNEGRGAVAADDAHRAAMERGMRLGASGRSIDELMDHTARKNVESVDERTKEAKRTNRRRYYKNVGITALGFGAGVLASQHMDGISDWVKEKTADKPVGGGASGGSSGEVISLPVIDGTQHGMVDSGALVDGGQSLGGDAVWTQMNSILGTSNSTPAILELVDKARAAGWEIDSWERGINSMTSPDGELFSGNDQVTTALTRLARS